MPNHIQHHTPLRTAVIGAGTFGAGIIAQAAYVPAMTVCAVADTHVELACQAYRLAGVTDARMKICQSLDEAWQALDSGFRVVTPFADIVCQLPVDVVAEATGSAEAGAVHASHAIAQGKHVAMVTKEADAAVGPILKARADQAGVIYTPVAGDQHGLLIEQVAWARMLGLEVLCGGKALDSEVIIETSPASFTYWGKCTPLSDAEVRNFLPQSSGSFDAVLSARAEKLGAIAGAKPWDLVEMTIAANATGLVPDRPATHCPSLWAGEIPSVLCPRELGGVLGGKGIIDAVKVLRRSSEPTFGGGVFIVIASQTPMLARTIGGDGLVSNAAGSAALIMRPHHLLGIEAIATILSAGRGEGAIKSLDYRPRLDVVYRTTRKLHRGEIVGDDHSPDLTAEMLPAAPCTPDAPLPAGLARGNRLCSDVRAGQIICGRMIEAPGDSMLWQLRREQDERFLKV